MQVEHYLVMGIDFRDVREMCMELERDEEYNPYLYPDYERIKAYMEEKNYCNTNKEALEKANQYFKNK